MIARSVLGALLVLALGFIWVNRVQTRTIHILHDEIQFALHQHLAEAPDVGFLPRVRFTQLDVSFGQAVQLEGSGNWFSLGAGAFVLPDVSVSAVIPIAPGSWLIEEGKLVVTRLEVTQAIREREEPTPESEINSAGWEEMLQTFVNRSAAFDLPFQVEDDWVLDDVAGTDDRLIFTVKKGRWTLPFL